MPLDRGGDIWIGGGGLSSPHFISPLFQCCMDLLLGGMGIGTAVHRALTSMQFLSSPHEAAREMWERSGYVLGGGGGGG